MVLQRRYLANYVLADRSSRLHQVQVDEVTDYKDDQILRVSFQAAEQTDEATRSIIDGYVLSGTLGEPNPPASVVPAVRHDVALLVETNDETVMLAVFIDPESGRLFALDLETLRQLPVIRSPYNPAHGFANKDLRIR
jgi:hypothetical protein